MLSKKMWVGKGKYVRNVNIANIVKFGQFSICKQRTYLVVLVQLLPLYHQRRDKLVEDEVERPCHGAESMLPQCLSGFLHLDMRLQRSAVSFSDSKPLFVKKTEGASACRSNSRAFFTPAIGFLPLTSTPSMSSKTPKDGIAVL
ncbi:hypothetical protein P5673_025888 [Acropora cervicornis]|uniref:Uncharacterized protein n=1 Tax=Acropora cervicornis TaxID=6130 RepID=A0AAD9UWW0_ACRCE|nr:hypothetical protein P5673_025888 [Acropora cervicornis]